MEWKPEINVECLRNYTSLRRRVIPQASVSGYVWVKSVDDPDGPGEIVPVEILGPEHEEGRP